MEKIEDADEVKKLIEDEQNGIFNEGTFLHAIINHIVTFSNPCFLEEIPSIYGNMVLGVVSLYEREGEWKTYSGKGESDHSELAAKLKIIMDDYMTAKDQRKLGAD